MLPNKNVSISSHRYINWVLFVVVLILFYGCVDQERIKKEQLMTSGSILYKTRCQNCHGEDGKGLGKAYPALAGSDFLMADRNRAICIVKNGLSGKVKVNGVDFNLQMPPNQDLTSIEISQILTYIENDWGNKAEYLKREEVEKALEKCK